MGQTVCAAVDEAEDLEVVARVDPLLDSTLEQALGDTAPDVVVEFTTPETVFGNARLCLERNVHVVVGATGMGKKELAELESLAGKSRANCFVAPNFAIGAVLMMRFAEAAARHLPRAEIVELHAETKLDAPSGTAKATAEKIGGDPPIHSVRLPGLVAHQEVLFGGDGQLLTIRHDAFSREAYVPGVLLALERLPSLAPGLTVGLDVLLGRESDAEE
jgi:4-hydroxy-tetrahydrodipicolinate reductase